MLQFLLVFLIAQVPVPTIGTSPIPIGSPSPITFAALTPRLTEISTEISSAASAAADAGFNAKGLGYFSPSHYFKTVEDDFSSSMRATNAGLDNVALLQANLTTSANAPPWLVSSTGALLSADKHALVYVRQYAEIAVVYERAVNAKNLAESSAIGWSFSNGYNPNLFNSVESVTSQKMANDRQLTVDQMREILQAQNESAKDIARSLIAPTTDFNVQCEQGDKIKSSVKTRSIE